MDGDLEDEPQPAASGAALAAPCPPGLIDERQLPSFRATYLNVDRVLAALAAHGSVLMNVAPGVGKSKLADRLLGDARLYQGDRLVVYLAPSHAIIHERDAAKRPGQMPVPTTLLRARDAALCGPGRTARWKRHDRALTSALGRVQVCAPCPSSKDGSCSWFDQFTTRRLRGVRLVLAPEAYLAVMPDFLLRLQDLTGASSVLVICDEAAFSGASFSLTLAPSDLAAFEDALALATGVDDAVRADGLAFVRALRAASDLDLQQGAWRYPTPLHRMAYEIQAAGVTHSTSFRYIGYLLDLFARSDRGERFRDATGQVSFIARPYVGVSKLVLAANLQEDYLQHRLRLDRVVPLFNGVRVYHSRTRFINIVQSAGSKHHLPGNFDRIVCLVATLIHRNILAGRRTLLVASKEWKQRFADALRARMATLWMPDVTFPIDGYDALDTPAPQVVPIIHYGIIGVNGFESFDAAYALNSYYARQDKLAERLQEAEPERFRVDLGIFTDERGYRRVHLLDPRLERCGLAELGGIYLRKMEVDVVLQALARVRFYTQPREVLAFQMNDLAEEVPGLIEVGNLDEARHQLGVPVYKTYLAREGARLLGEAVQGGLTLKDAAAELGVPYTTARNWIRASKNHLGG